VNKSDQQNLPLVPDWLASKLDNWIKAKNHTHPSCYQINRKNIYILPSKSGWLFILTLIAILSGAINYNNSMAYLLCFFLASLGFIAMLQTHQNLNKLTIQPAQSHAVFCGQDIEYNYKISDQNFQNHYTLCFAHNSNSISVEKKSDAEFSVIEKSKKRGKQTASRFKIYTEFPLGLFHAWSQININNEIIIYPKPVKHLLTESSYQSGNKQATMVDGDDFSGIREFRRGDSPKKLAWKSIAKTSQLYTKEFHTEAGEFLIFDFDQLSHINNTEEKLSILCALIIQAHNDKKDYGLKLPNKSIKPGHNEQHKHHCLTLLALYKP